MDMFINCLKKYIYCFVKRNLPANLSSLGTQNVLMQMDTLNHKMILHAQSWWYVRVNGEVQVCVKAAVIMTVQAEDHQRLIHPNK